jgi:Glycosyltransferases, probably involved in cell wall biogenesis
MLNTLQTTPWHFPCTIITSHAIQYAGENRNIGCRNATGDIFILQDADDIPHPQRIEIISYFFEHYPIDHLMHYYEMVNSHKKSTNFSLIHDIKNIRHEHRKQFRSINVSNIRGNHLFHNGNIAIKKRVFDHIQWSNTLKRGQDYDFNLRIYEKFNKQTLLLHIPLMYYRMFLSTIKNQDCHD